MPFHFEEGEILLINKPYRWTSFDVVHAIKKTLKQISGNKIKIGHAGTLDPLATGLLIICTGKFTKRIEEFQDLEKEYTGRITLGATTPCYDLEKPIDKTYPVSHITEEKVADAAKKFIGTFAQIPPLFSAKQIDGQRAYKFARRGEQIELKPREVKVSEFKITRIEIPDVEFKVVCSKGTYIRSLARDFGEALNSGAHLSALCRTRIGEYKLESALSVEKMNEFITG